MKRSRAPSQVAKKAKASRVSAKGQQMSLNPTRLPYTPKWGFPNRLAIAHKYVETVTLTSTSGSLASNLFRCNGMFDPNQSGTGHQPMYFDELAAIYDHYTVIRSEIKITAALASTTKEGGVLAVYIDDDTTVANTLQTALEQNTSSYKMLCNEQGQQVVLKKKWSAESFGPSPLDNDNLQGTGSTDPSEQSYFVVQWQSIGTPAPASAQLALTCEVTYYAIWDELKTNSGS